MLKKNPTQACLRMSVIPALLELQAGALQIRFQPIQFSNSVRPCFKILKKDWDINQYEGSGFSSQYCEKSKQKQKLEMFATFWILHCLQV